MRKPRGPNPLGFYTEKHHDGKEFTVHKRKKEDSRHLLWWTNEAQGSERTPFKTCHCLPQHLKTHAEYRAWHKDKQIPTGGCVSACPSVRTLYRGDGLGSLFFSSR